MENPAKPEERVVNTGQCPRKSEANKKIFEFLKEMKGISWSMVNPAKRNITSNPNDGSNSSLVDTKNIPDNSKVKERSNHEDTSKDRAGAIRKEL